MLHQTTKLESVYANAVEIRNAQAAFVFVMSVPLRTDYAKSMRSRCL
jgi:hypothetical protein